MPVQKDFNFSHEVTTIEGRQTAEYLLYVQSMPGEQWHTLLMSLVQFWHQSDNCWIIYNEYTTVTKTLGKV